MTSGSKMEGQPRYCWHRERRWREYAEMEVTNKSSDVLKPRAVRDRSSGHIRVSLTRSTGRDHGQVRAHPEVFGGLTELEQAEFAGDVVKAESLKIQAVGD